MLVLSVVGARPNFMKIAPIIRAIGDHPGRLESVLVHTGQHYDEKMSDSFFRDLSIPPADFNLEVGSGTHATQTAAVMARIEPVLIDVRPDIVLVVGDVNSTLAAAITAKKLNLRVAHVEAGLRSRDRSMPEEINRICTDAVADYLFTTERSADENLIKEGRSRDQIHFVGNVMIDSLLAALPAVEQRQVASSMGLEIGTYAVLTLHRPANVDDFKRLVNILEAILDGLSGVPVIFPIHPRTAARLKDVSNFRNGLTQQLRLVEPMPYIEFLSLVRNSRIVLTDSGGLQEESLVMGVPSVTLRENTERPVTLEHGANRLAGVSRSGIMSSISAALALPARRFPIPELWDGHAAERIVQVLLG